MPAWGTPRQWYVIGVLGLLVVVLAGGLNGSVEDGPLRFALNGVGSLGLLAFFGGFGIGVTKSRGRR